MLAFLEGPDLIVVLVVVLVLFGGAKLPQLARSLGQAKNEFERGVRSGETPAQPASSTTAPTATTDETITLSKAELDKLIEDRVREAARERAEGEPPTR